MTPRPDTAPLPRGTAGLAAFALLSALLSACRGGLNSTCHCAADCRSGLSCSAEGEKKLLVNTCFGPGISGVCVESDELDSDSGDPVSLTETDRQDLNHSRRDFAPGGLSDGLSSGSTSPTTTESTTAPTGTTSTTGETSTGTTGTTGDTSSSGSSIGTTGGDSSSGSSSGSSSSGSSSSTT